MNPELIITEEMKREFILNQYRPDGKDNELFPELVGYERYGDIAAAAVYMESYYRENPLFNLNGQIKYEISEDQSTPDGEMLLAYRGLVRTTLNDSLIGDDPSLANKFLRIVGNITAERVGELSEGRDELWLSVFSQISVRRAKRAKDKIYEDGAITGLPHLY